MTCILPTEPDDFLLMAFLDGEADELTALHLKRCCYCRERLESLAHEQNFLTSHLFRLSCPPAAELGEYHLSLLSPDQALKITQHLDECPHCTREVDQLDDFLVDLVSEVEGKPLQHTRQLTASLVGQAEEGVRPGSPFVVIRAEKDMPLIFEAEGLLVMVDVQRTMSGRIDIRGQVAADHPDSWTNALIKLKQVDQSERSLLLDAMGSFKFENLPPCPADLQIKAKDGTTVVIPKIDSQF